jgi:hypothetical protein
MKRKLYGERTESEERRLKRIGSSKEKEENKIKYEK